MRAVADNQQVAMAMGINVERYFGLAWAMTGVVSALGGVLWGNMLGVDVNLALVGFKVFPVVILGGLDSIPGRDHRRPHRRHRGERGRGLRRSVRGRRHEGLRALRPDDPRADGPTLRHVRQTHHRASVRRMIHRECGVLKTTYEADMALYPLPIAKYTVAALGVLFFLVIPLSLHEYYLSIANLVWIAVIGALGLNILVGYTGQVSIGHGAFMSVGAYTAANFATRLDSPWPVNLLAGGLMAALIGGDRRHPVAAHQGPLPGHRDPRRPAHHRVDDQPRDVHQRRRAGVHRGAAAARGARGAATRSATCTTSCSSSSCSPSWAR